MKAQITKPHSNLPLQGRGCLILFFFILPSFWEGLEMGAFAQKIAVGGHHSLAICSNNTVMAWGNNGNGQLGDGTTISRVTPVPVNALTGITALAGGGLHSLALKSDGTVWTWGYNILGQLGDGTTTDKTNPVQVNGITGIIAITGGYEHSFALKNDGTVWAWGRNNEGMLGDGTNISRNTPVQVSGLIGIIAISGGGEHSLALKNDGTVWAWGRNANGQLGDGTTTDKNIPVQINGLTGIIGISGGGYHSLALKNDGTVWTWGDNMKGQLGDGTIVQRIVPVQVNSLTGIAGISGGGYHSLALKSDGTAWIWGMNDYGQLGDGTITQRNSPVQASSLSGITALAGGWLYSLFLKNDGTVWGCGWNFYGQIGDSTTDNSNIPVQAIGLCPIAVSVTTTVASTNLICNGQCTGTGTASPSGGTSPYTYSWNTIPAQTSSTATGLCAGNYAVTVTDAASMTSTATVNITQPAALNLNVGSTSNTNCIFPNGIATVNANGGTPGYTYSWNTVPIQTNETATGLIAGNYTVTVIDINACTQTATVNVSATPGSVITLSPDVTISPGDNTQLTATGGVTYLWNTGDTNSSITISPAQTTNYCITVTDANGCSDTACVRVTVDVLCGKIYVPNAFSPNNDGENDLECVLGGCIESFHITIYDRWGEKVFSATGGPAFGGETLSWDGTYKGKLMNTATFVYYLKAKLTNGEEIIKKGNISLVR